MIEVPKNNFTFNDEVNQCLQSIIKNKSFANGYIFYGAEGIGKKQNALNFINEIFKQYSPEENIEEKITNNNHPDCLIIKPSSNVEGKRIKSSDLDKKTKSENEIIATGGRVLNFVSVSDSFFKAREEIHKNLSRLRWDNGFYRKDIASKVINKE